VHLCLHPHTLFLCLSSFAMYPTYSFNIFAVCRGHQALHSFPTRRSSDLSRTHGVKQGKRRRVAPKPYLLLSSTALQSQLCPSLRSEEHTSEFQSRFDLVCRLLLEKKNNRCYG